MARKYLELAEAAVMLGITEDRLLELRSKGEISGYRDGPNWKFKEDDLEKLAGDLAQGNIGEDDLEPTGDLAVDDDDSVLLSDQAVSDEGVASSSTIIGAGGDAASAGESDLKLDDAPVEPSSDLNLQAGSSDVQLVDEAETTSGEGGTSDLALAGSDLNLAGDSDVSLAGSGVGSGVGGGSALDLGDEDDDLVLGDTGSDITIGSGDSGISLVDPTDSGISLEQPLDLAGSGAESLELGEDDMISLEEEADLDSPTQLKADDDFLLTPLEEAEDASDSGSQVIALDSEEGVGDSADSLAGGVPTMATMLEEDVGAMPGSMGLTAAGASPLLAAPAAPEVPEYPYTVWNVLSLFGCIIFLTLGGMMTYELINNIGSWNGVSETPATISDSILKWFESKG